jgi:hypothetical protein
MSETSETAETTIDLYDFITLLGGGAAWPLPAWAQQPGQMRHIGVLMGVADDAEGQRHFKASRL